MRLHKTIELSTSNALVPYGKVDAPAQTCLVLFCCGNRELHAFLTLLMWRREGPLTAG